MGRALGFTYNSGSTLVYRLSTLEHVLVLLVLVLPILDAIELGDRYFGVAYICVIERGVLGTNCVVWRRLERRNGLNASGDSSEEDTDRSTNPVLVRSFLAVGPALRVDGILITIYLLRID